MDDFVVVYINDLLVYIENKEDHFIYLNIVLIKLREHNLFSGKDKCYFMTEIIKFLGLQVSSEGISIEKVRIRAVGN